MSEIFNRQPQKRTRQTLRKQPIIAEKRLWSKLRHQELGYKFRRQHGIGKYIVDFYCPKLKFIVELDGDTHSTEEEIIYDDKRQKYLEKLGLVVKRYWNSEIRENINGVVGNILEVCRKLDKN
ncbi:MAG: endonuclease domain-containing protein [Candidatus Falkowbacteria bacterium]